MKRFDEFYDGVVRPLNKKERRKILRLRAYMDAIDKSYEDEEDAFHDPMTEHYGSDAYEAVSYSFRKRRQAIARKYGIYNFEEARMMYHMLVARAEAWQAKQEQQWLEKNKKPMLFLNVYMTNRAYGGPEEGGWWYDYGVFQECLGTFFSPDNAAEALEKWQRIASARNKERGSYGDIGSVLCEGALRVRLERHPGCDYPTQRPYYC